MVSLDESILFVFVRNLDEEMRSDVLLWFRIYCSFGVGNVGERGIVMDL